VTTYTLRTGAAEKTSTDVVVVGVVEAKKSARLAPAADGIAAAYGRKLGPLLATLGMTGKKEQVATLPTAGVVKTPMLVLVGLGPADAVTPDVIRRAAGAAARAVNNAASVTLALPARDAEEVRAATEGYMLGAYSFDAYRSSKPKDRPQDVVVLSDLARRAEVVSAFRTAQVVADAVARTRDWVNTPPGDLTPGRFADAIVARGNGPATPAAVRAVAAAAPAVLTAPLREWVAADGAEALPDLADAGFAALRESY